MFKKIVVAMAIVVCSAAFTINSMAATLSQTIVGPVVYAQELFGSGSETVVLVNGAAVTLTTAGTVVDTGEISDFTFTLVNGVLGTAVNLITDIVLTSALGEISVTIRAGGAAGDSSVTFRIEVITDLAIGNTIAFNIPTVTGASGLADVVTPTVVSVSSSVSTFATGGVGTFPTSITQTGTVIASAADENVLTVVPAGDHTLDVDNRSDVNSATDAVDHDDDGSAVTPDRDGVIVGVVSTALNGVSVQRDGMAFNYAEDGAGTLELTISGPFNAGATVCADLNGDFACNTGEVCPIVGTTATCSLLLFARLPFPVYWIPDGVAELAPATYSLTAATSFSLVTNLNDTGMSSASTTFDGLFPDGWSMVVPKSTSNDQSNIRLTNETGVAVAVFATGTGQDGAALGTMEVLTLAAMETRVLSSADFEAIFGVWVGRARFDFLVSGNVSVQSFIRSGGVLNNMTGSSGTSNDGEQELR